MNKEIPNNVLRPPEGELIEVRHVERIYYDTTGRQTIALQDVNLDIRRGEFISFIGPSGCGKTTLLRLIAGLDFPQGGRLSIEGKTIRKPGPDRGFVFQQAALFPWKTVEGNIAIGLKAGKVYKEKKVKIKEYIDMIGLSGFEKAYPHEISGGMAQRVAIARALINEPKVLLLDEPLGALDAFTRIDLQDTLRQLWKQTRTTIALVTHDVDEALSLSNRIAIMTSRPGQISEIIEVKIGNKSDRNDDTFISLRKRVLEKLHLAGLHASQWTYTV
ncbi:MAG: ABC transporter ATP-binding protein [Tannerella sp.]|jgi:ABC-type nitrate/sulfonate/bicarbonate transport system ATPase subunit|nr:ABC transporter ATP-binding protein [Tannerella sp.]